MMAEAKTDVLAFTSFPKAHWQKIWSNNPISVNRPSGDTSRVAA
jgi:transposase-like protein